MKGEGAVNSYSIHTDDITVIYFAGDLRPESIGGDHCHDKYEITLTLSASGHCRIEGMEVALSPRTLILIKPLVYHRVSLENEPLFEGYTVCFSKSALSGAVLDMLERISEGESESGRYYSSKSVSDAIISAFERFEIADILPEKERGALVNALLSEIIILLSAEEGQNMTLTDGELGAKVVRYLNDNITKNISLDRLARRFFVSKYHLCRAFKSYSGISVHSYINHKRIMYARQLIEAGETASGAAYKVGFGDYSAFYRAYVKIVGKSPTRN
nr:helix-turn-helix transcriptional regulator [Oscillospiraceae bacterium]